MTDPQEDNDDVVVKMEPSELKSSFESRVVLWKDQCMKFQVEGSESDNIPGMFIP